MEEEERMKKKIAQLTKVCFKDSRTQAAIPSFTWLPTSIHHTLRYLLQVIVQLNTRNEEHDAEIYRLHEAHEDEIAAVIKVRFKHA